MKVQGKAAAKFRQRHRKKERHRQAPAKAAAKGGGEGMGGEGMGGEGMGGEGMGGEGMGAPRDARHELVGRVEQQRLDCPALLLQHHKEMIEGEGERWPRERARDD